MGVTTHMILFLGPWIVAGAGLAGDSLNCCSDGLSQAMVPLCDRPVQVRDGRGIPCLEEQHPRAHSSHEGGGVQQGPPGPCLAQRSDLGPRWQRWLLPRAPEAWPGPFL